MTLSTRQSRGGREGGQNVGGRNMWVKEGRGRGRRDDGGRGGGGACPYLKAFCDGPHAVCHLPEDGSLHRDPAHIARGGGCSAM